MAAKPFTWSASLLGRGGNPSHTPGDLTTTAGGKLRKQTTRSWGRMGALHPLPLASIWMTLVFASSVRRVARIKAATRERLAA